MRWPLKVVEEKRPGRMYQRFAYLPRAIPNNRVWVWWEYYTEMWTRSGYDEDWAGSDSRWTMEKTK